MDDNLTLNRYHTLELCDEILSRNLNIMFDTPNGLWINSIREEVNSNMYIAGMLNSGSYHLNPLKLTTGLAKVASDNKVKIFENTPIEKIKEEGDKVKVISKKGIIKANKVVVACNGYLDSILGSKKNKFMPINNYVVATEPLGEKMATWSSSGMPESESAMAARRDGGAY